jgi:hypothetical protein
MEDKAMKSTERFLELYREGDFEKRLSLFLECPALRSRFIEIDQSESSKNYSLGASRKDIAVSFHP